jgi:hypothetical protein
MIISNYYYQLILFLFSLVLTILISIIIYWRKNSGNQNFISFQSFIGYFIHTKSIIFLYLVLILFLYLVSASILYFFTNDLIFVEKNDNNIQYTESKLLGNASIQLNNGMKQDLISDHFKKTFIINNTDIVLNIEKIIYIKHSHENHEGFAEYVILPMSVFSKTINLYYLINEVPPDKIESKYDTEIRYWLKAEQKK